MRKGLLFLYCTFCLFTYVNASLVDEMWQEALLKVPPMVRDDVRQQAAELVSSTFGRVEKEVLFSTVTLKEATLVYPELVSNLTQKALSALVSVVVNNNTEVWIRQDVGSLLVFLSEYQPPDEFFLASSVVWKTVVGATLLVASMFVAQNKYSAKVVFTCSFSLLAALFLPIHLYQLPVYASWSIIYCVGLIFVGENPNLVIPSTAIALALLSLSTLLPTHQYFFDLASGFDIRQGIYTVQTFLPVYCQPVLVIFHGYLMNLAGLYRAAVLYNHVHGAQVFIGGMKVYRNYVYVASVVSGITFLFTYVRRVYVYYRCSISRPILSHDDAASQQGSNGKPIGAVVADVAKWYSVSDTKMLKYHFASTFES